RKRPGDAVELECRFAADRAAIDAQFDLLEGAVDSKHPPDDSDGVALGLDHVEVAAGDLSEVIAHAEPRAAPSQRASSNFHRHSHDRAAARLEPVDLLEDETVLEEVTPRLIRRLQRHGKRDEFSRLDPPVRDCPAAIAE